MSCKRPKFPIDQDPDYEDIIAHQNKRIKLLEKDANEKSIKKIQRIVKNQFAHSIGEKEVEIDMVDQRLSQARVMLDRLRAYIVAGYYSAPEKFPNDSVRNSQTSVHPTIKKMLCGKKPSGEKLKLDKLETQTKSPIFEELKPVHLLTTTNPIKEELKTVTEIPKCVEAEQTNSESAYVGRGSRFKVTKKIIVGNTSQYIPDAKREPKDPLIYKWMVYVRAPEGEASIDSFVKKVSFVLHPSFGSNSVVEVSKPPFRIIRRGWGEFPIRVQIDFHDPRNKNKTVVHALKFDKAFTGFETRGAETIAEFHIYKPEKMTNNKRNEKMILSPEVTIPGPDIKKNNEVGVANISQAVINSEEKECALPLVTKVSKTEENEKTPILELPQAKIPFNDNNTPVVSTNTNQTTLISTNANENTLTKNESVKVKMTTGKRTLIKPQITVFPKKSNILGSSKLLTDKIVILSPEPEKKSSASFSLISNRQEKIIVPPSANLIRANEPAMSKRWTAGVSLLQKTKSKVTATNQQDLSKNTTTLIVVPNANNNQEKKIFKISTDQFSTNFQTAIRTTTSNNNAVTPVLLLPAAGKTNILTTGELILTTGEVNNLKTVSRPAVKETSGGSNGVNYFKCTGPGGEKYIVDESCLEIPQQSFVLPKTTAVGANSSSLPMYHVQVIPSTSSTTQTQVISLNSLKNTMSSNAIKSSTQAQNVKLGSLLNTNNVAQTLFVSNNKVVTVPSIAIEATKKHVEIENFDDMDDVVKYFVKFYPITARNCDKTIHPYCAPSVDVFLSWNIGRQRAAEWQRAKAVKKLIMKVFGESNKWKGKEIWSTKKILWWCRRWGFSPMKSDIRVSNGDVTTKVLGYSEANELCTQLVKNQKKIEEDKGEYDELEIIDVESLDESVSSSNISESPAKKNIFEQINLPSTPELEFIQNAVTQIGVKLKAVEVYPGVLANIVDGMLLSACKCFLENLTRRSLVEAFKRLGDKKSPSTLNLEDVCHCIETVPQFDFLTHKFLGKNNTVDSQFSTKDVKEN